MDTKTLIAETKARFKHQEAKIYVQEKYQGRMVLAAQGGFWSVTPEFLSFLAAAPDTVIIVDSFDRPVPVNTAELRQSAWELYNRVTQEWLAEWQQLETAR